MMSADYPGYVIKKHGVVEVPDGYNVMGQAQNNTAGKSGGSIQQAGFACFPNHTALPTVRRAMSDKEILLMHQSRRSFIMAATAGLGGIAAWSHSAFAAASARQINHDADRVLHSLFTAQPKMRQLGDRARAMLIFPRIVKAGLVIGGQSGDGVLREQGRPSGFYNLTAASLGLQAGVQSFSYVLFFMNDTALKYLKDSNGWSIGSGPSVVVVDKGAAKNFTSTTLTQDVYAVPFGQHGLMAGIDLEGSKITPITVHT